MLAPTDKVAASLVIDSAIGAAMVEPTMPEDYAHGHKVAGPSRRAGRQARAGSRSVLVFDDFLPTAAQVREIGVKAPYIDWPGPDGEVYKRVCLTEVQGLRERIEAVMGPVDMLGMGYRLNFAGELPNAAVHSDLGWGSHALVLYLCEGEGGTAFWRHRRTGAERIEPGDADLFEQVRGDWNDASAWEQIELVGMRFNRALIYESALFHSRYPFAAFGSGPDDGRLIAVAFFTPRTRLMGVRRATEADTPAVLEMGRRFYATTLYERFADYHDETVLRLIAMMRETGVLLVFESEGRLLGMVGLLIAPFLFDARRKAAYEVMWWVDPKSQGAGIGSALLEAIEPACREAGCAAIQMVRLASSPPQARALYEREGYAASEFCHTMILEEKN